jgi:exodeoxyribonuclease-5
LLSAEQKTIVDSIITEILQYRSTGVPFLIRVGGYAGTGKTFLLANLRREVAKFWGHLEIAFATFTGKASSVLKNRLIENNGIFGHDFIGTIHSLIYHPRTLYNPQLKKWIVVGWRLKKQEELFCDIIFIDEGSMVSKDLWKDLLKFGKPIVVVGDHGQLPPIGEGNFSLMHDPDFLLTEIHRQALNSPIIKLSKFIRENGYIPFKIKSKDVLKTSWKTEQCQDIWKEINFDENTMILCAFNTSRANINNIVRTKLGYTKIQPYPGERIVCLKNNRSSGIMNGQIASVLWYMPEANNLYRLTLYIEGESDPIESVCSDKCFGQVSYSLYDENHKKDPSAARRGLAVWKGVPIDYFDYGNCISVHKSQGSEWDKIILFEQRSKHWDDNFYMKWLYTAVTRARKKLLVIADAYI